MKTRSSRRHAALHTLASGTALLLSVFFVVVDAVPAAAQSGPAESTSVRREQGVAPARHSGSAQQPAFEIRRDLRMNPSSPVRSRVIVLDHESQSMLYQIFGARPNDLFGWAVMEVGDVDGDGVTDLVISAPNAQIGSGYTGEVTLHSGADGTPLWAAGSLTGETFGVGLADPEAAGLSLPQHAVLVRTYWSDSVLGEARGWQALDLATGTVIGVGMESDLARNPEWHAPDGQEPPPLISEPVTDLNADGMVDADDLNELLRLIGVDPRLARHGDINSDGVIDAADLQVLIGRFGANADLQGLLGCVGPNGEACCFCWQTGCVGGVVVGHCGPNEPDDGQTHPPPGTPAHCRNDDDGDGIADWKDCDHECYVGNTQFDCGCQDSDGDGVMNQNDCDSPCYAGPIAECACDTDTDGDGLIERDEDDDCDGIPNGLDCDSACFEGDPDQAPCCQDDDEDGIKNQDDPNSGCYIEPAVNLTIDSDNSGSIGGEDDQIEEEKPGRVVIMNDDDDNEDSLLDLNQDGIEFEDDELVPVEINAPDAVGEWRLHFAGSTRVYTGSDRSDEIESGEPNELPAPDRVYVEALAASAASGDRWLRLEVSWDHDDNHETPNCVASDRVRFTAMLMTASGPGNISVDEGDGYIGALFSLADESALADAAEIVDELEVSLRLVRDDSIVSEEMCVIELAGVAQGFGIGTEPDVGFEGGAGFLGATRRTEPFATRAGEPAAIQLGPIDPPGASDGVSTLGITVYVYDRYGNAVSEGVPVSWLLEGSTAELVDLPEEFHETWFGGFAVASIELSDISSPDPLRIITQSGHAELETTVSIDGASITSLTPSATSIDIHDDESSIITLSASNVTDGASVDWLISNGVIASGGLANPRAATTTIANGTSSIEVVASSGSGGLVSVGACDIVAHVGDRNIRARIQFTADTHQLDPTPSLEVSNAVIAGDIAADTLVAVQPMVFTTLPGNPPPAPGQPRVVEVLCPASTQITVRGAPFAAYEFNLANPSDFEFVGLVVEGEHYNGPVQIGTDLFGRATITLQSKGTFTLAEGQAAHSINVTVKLAGASPGTRVFVTVPMTSSLVYAELVSGLTLFLGLSDPQTGPEIAANIAGGVFIVGDIGAIAKNVLRFAGLMEGEPNWMEVLLSGAGLLTEFAVGAGEVLDVPISILRAVVAAIGNNPATRALVVLFKRAVLHGQSIDEFAALMKGFTVTGTNVTHLRQAIDSPELAMRLGRAADGLGEQAAGELYRHIDTLVAAGRTADAKAVSAFLGSPSLPAGFLNNLSSLPVPRQQAFYQSFTVLAGRVGLNGIKRTDKRILQKILTNPRLVGAGYDVADLAEDLAKVASMTADSGSGFMTLARRLRSTNPSNAKGALYELTVASKYIDTGFQGIPVAEVTMIAKLTKTPAGRTDMDLVLELTNRKMVIVQAKATNLSGDAAIEAAKTWVKKAQSLASEEVWNDYQIVYAVPSSLIVSEPLEAALGAFDPPVLLNRTIDLAFPH